MPSPPDRLPSTVPPRKKPLLRGVSHQIAFFLAMPFLYWLVAGAPSPTARASAAIYAVSLLALLGISALYHRRHWGPVGRRRMARLDHSVIFVLIAGSYTPICLVGVGGDLGMRITCMLWTGAILGILQTLFWPSAPRWLHVGLYVVIGWLGAAALPGEWQKLGPLPVCMHILGGVLYTLGAVAYARKRPDPWPTVFGYHEIFHLLILFACACLFFVIQQSVQHAAILAAR
jgi:hemolysin III